VTSVGNKTVLGLFVEGTNSITYKMLSATMTLKFKFPLFEIGWIDRLERRSQLVQTLIVN
jgi:hypothetical protein